MEKEYFSKILQCALLADAHSMCTHWNYDNESIQKSIEDKVISLDMLNSGDHSSYYKGKRAGDLSHHGDQLLHLYEYASSHAQFSIEDYVHAWKSFIESYAWYVDGSSKTTIKNINQHVQPIGSNSTDFCGVSMGLPLLHYETVVESHAIELACARTRMTHDNIFTLDTTRWFISSLFRISTGEHVLQAMDAVAETIDNNIFSEVYAQGKALCSSRESIASLITQVGPGCDIRSGLPILIVLIHRHHTNLVDFMKENTLAGADITSRSLIGGALIGAMESTDVPQDMYNQLQVRVL